MTAFVIRKGVRNVKNLETYKLHWLVHCTQSCNLGLLEAGAWILSGRYTHHRQMGIDLS
jgi:hypothetical protein